MKDKCDGSCCERFYIGQSQEELAQLAIDYPDDPDSQEIAKMVILLGPSDHQEGKVGGFWYTCKNWDDQTRLCKIYESRPQMCRDYPYSSPCVNCGWENQEFVERKQRESAPAGSMGLGPKGVSWSGLEERDAEI